jgi:2',3'-cyclic-nucleotide 2'-phosphodiesterase (5'-nucleotidase family)
MKIIIITDTHGADTLMPKLSAAVQQTVQDAKDKDEKVIVVHCGDIFGYNKLLSGSSEGKFDRDVLGKIARAVPKDHRFIVPGNHEYIKGEGDICEFPDKIGFQLVVTNRDLLREDTQTFEKSVSHIIIDEGDKRIAILGLMTKETRNCTHHPLKDSDEGVDPDVLQKKIRELKDDEGVSQFIVMSHLGLESDKQLAQKLKGLGLRDIIICGGHSHVQTPKAVQEEGITIVNGGAYGEGFVLVDSKNPSEGEFVDTTKYPDDPEIERIIKHYAEQASQALTYTSAQDLQKTFFTTKIPLLGLEDTEDDSHRIHDSFMGRLTTDALKSYTGAEIALIPVAAIRSNLGPGEITGKDIMETYFGGNKVRIIKASGEDIVRALALGVRTGYKHWVGRSCLLHPSEGLTYSYDVSGEPEDVIKSVMFNGSLIESARTYSVAATDWLVNKLFQGSVVARDQSVQVSKTQFSEPQIGEVVIAYLKEHSIVEVVKEVTGERITALQDFVAQEQARLAFEADGGRREDGAVPTEVSINLPMFAKRQTFGGTSCLFRGCPEKTEVAVQTESPQP